MRTKPKFLAACSWSLPSAGRMDHHPIFPAKPALVSWQVSLVVCYGQQSPGCAFVKQALWGGTTPCLSTVVSFHLSFLSCVSPCTHSPSTLPATCPSVHPPVHSPIHPTVFSLIHLSTQPPIHPPTIHSSASSSEPPHLLSHLSTHLPAHLSIFPPRTAHPFCFGFAL